MLPSLKKLPESFEDCHRAALLKIIATMQLSDYGNRDPQLIAAAAVITALVAVSLSATAANSTNPPTAGILLTDSLGRVVRVPTNEVPASLRPPAAIDGTHQTPQSAKGARQLDLVSERTELGRAGAEGFVFFPAVQPRLMPYLANLDEFGNTALKPSAWLAVGPLEPEAQGAKYWLSEHGLRYSLQQTITGVGLTDVRQGNNGLGFYEFDWQSKWAVFDAPGTGAGWLSTHFEIKSGLGAAGMDQSAGSNIGSVTEPTGFWSGVNGIRVSELAWQQSLRDGEVVVVAGMVNQGDYLDANAYANSGRGQFINSALINSQVLPLPGYNFGANLQWQPHEDWYTMLGTSAGNAKAGHVPWTDFSMNTWSLVGELGYAPADFMGWGPGVYRVQPFIAQADGPTQGGIGFNFQQQLGADSPLGWFGRFGTGGSAVAAGAKVQIGTGLVAHAPLYYAGLLPKRANDSLGSGFVWSQPSATSQTVYHDNEYIWETFYAVQLTPLTKLQPDLQVVWNPAFNPDAGPATVFQIQLIIAW